MSDPDWTRVRPSLGQRSVIDYVVTDMQLMRDVQVDATDIGASDHSLKWMELGREPSVTGETQTKDKEMASS